MAKRLQLLAAFVLTLPGVLQPAAAAPVDVAVTSAQVTDRGDGHIDVLIVLKAREKADVFSHALCLAAGYARANGFAAVRRTEFFDESAPVEGVETGLVQTTGIATFGVSEGPGDDAVDTVLADCAANGIASEPPDPARAEADWNLMREIAEAFELTNDAATAREAHALCLDISRRVGERTDLEDVHRLYFESMISKCIAHAMNNGMFTDASGDPCSHQYDAASKLAKALSEADGKVAYAEMMPTLRHDLDSTINMSGALACKQDFDALRKN